MDVIDNNSIPKNLFYRESNEIQPLGLSISYILCGIAALGLGYLYGVIVTINPFIYFNFLACIGLGVSLGFIARLIVRVTHNRNKKSRYVIAVVTGLLAVVFQWLLCILNIYLDSIPSFMEFLSNLHWLVLPQNSFPVVAEIYKFGLWSIAGIPFNGLVLGFIWLIEAGIIIFIPTKMMLQLKPFPYSENQNKWYRKYTLNKDFAPIYSDRMSEALAQNPIEIIQDMGKGMGNRYGKFHIYYIKNESIQYISFDNVWVDNKGKKEIDQIIPPIRIESTVAKEILSQFENKKESLDIF